MKEKKRNEKMPEGEVKVSSTFSKVAERETESRDLALDLKKGQRTK